MRHRLLLIPMLLSAFCVAPLAAAQETTPPEKVVGWYGFDVTADHEVKCRKITSGDAKTFTGCMTQQDNSTFECRVSAEKAFWVYKTKKACLRALKVWNSDKYQG